MRSTTPKKKKKTAGVKRVPHGDLGVTVRVRFSFCEVGLARVKSTLTGVEGVASNALLIPPFRLSSLRVTALLYQKSLHWL